MPPILTALSEISARYDALFCDLWGCLHNGVQVYPEAVAALEAFRAQGGTVILVTNSPRPAASVAKQLAGMGAPQSCYDAIASSGDAAQAALASGAFGRKVYHLGPERDLPFFSDPDGTPYDVERVPLDEAEGIVCTGLFDDRTETPEDYRLTIAQGVHRGLKLLCANPDILVDVGDQRIYCAGALAEAYTAAGGESFYFGKPHPPIYDLAKRHLIALGRSVEDAGILCVGDGLITDIRGANGEGLDSVWITGGLAAEATSSPPGGSPDPDKAHQVLGEAQLNCTGILGYLR
ncbi:MAG: TIGR01459 family HAD-type hydrolase [Pseudomonadota bacterium]